MNHVLSSSLGSTLTVKFVLYFSKSFAVHEFGVLLYFNVYCDDQSTKSADRVCYIELVRICATQEITILFRGSFSASCGSHYFCILNNFTQ